MHVCRPIVKRNGVFGKSPFRIAVIDDGRIFCPLLKMIAYKQIGKSVAIGIRPGASPTELKLGGNAGGLSKINKLIGLYLGL